MTPSNDSLPTVIIITGPTASGKSQAALEMALCGIDGLMGEIVNADSMQLYEHLPILTAFPSREDRAAVPHHLYGILGDDQISSAGWWVQTAEAAICDILGRGRVPILVGGTGMYLNALTEGLSPLPEIPPEIREVARQRAMEEGFFDVVCAQDSQVAQHLGPTDQQRLTRALEVMMATGRSLFDWQTEPRTPSPFSFRKYAIIPEREDYHKNKNSTIAEREDSYQSKCSIIPDREELYRRINDRFVQMIGKGAIEEVEALMKRPVHPESPILRALGVKEIRGYLEGSLTKEKMIELAQQASRNYAKRQLTWLRTQGKGYGNLPHL